MTKNTEGSQLKYDLPRELDLLSAVDLKDTLLGLMDKEGDLMLNASEVERISTPCIEVLFSAQNAFKEAGHKFEIENPSVYLCDAFKTLGLDDHLQRWSAS